MEEEYSKQEEARRILESIRHKEAADADEAAQPEKEFPRLPSEEAAKLQAFINTTIQSKSPPPPPVEEEIPEPVDIDPISTEQIKVMRKFAADKVEVKEPLKKTLSEFAIRSYFELMAYLSPPNRAQKCREDGHHLCVNCGIKIPLPTAPAEEDPDAATGPASSNPASH